MVLCYTACDFDVTNDDYEISLYLRSFLATRGCPQIPNQLKCRPG
jgi:hypothetical protein